MRISIWESKELQATILALKGLDSELRSQINRRTKSVALDVWKEEVTRQTTTELEQKVIRDTAKVSVTAQNVTLRAGAAKRLSGGATARELLAGTEFGSRRHKQFRQRNKKGHVAFPAARNVIPRIASLWIQTTIRAVHEAFEGR